MQPALVVFGAFDKQGAFRFRQNEHVNPAAQELDSGVFVL
jgi:hypothetical protein